jgi:hypothetical protein
MARKQRKASSGAPGLKIGGTIGPALNPLGLSQRGGHNYLDPSVAMQEIEHPSAKWAGIELMPCRPRE